MKAILYLILIASMTAGCIWVYKEFFTATEKETETETVEAVKKPEKVKPGERPAVDNLSTARTPVSKSKIGKKINKIYSDHNRGVEKATK